MTNVDGVANATGTMVLVLAVAVLATAGTLIAIGLIRLVRAGRFPRAQLATNLIIASVFGGLALAGFAEVAADWTPIPEPTPQVWFVLSVLALIAAILAWRMIAQSLKEPSILDRLAQLKGESTELHHSLAARTQELKQTDAYFNEAIKGSTVTVFAQDTELRYIWVYNPAPGWEAEKILGLSDYELMPENEGRALIAYKERVLQSEEVVEGVEVQLPIGLARRDFSIRIGPQYRQGKLVGIQCTAVDVTEQKEQERHLRLVMRELTHRSKNLLAVVQAIARQMANTSPSVEDYMLGFSSRLQALSGAHDLLVNEGWKGASLSEIAQSQLGPLVDPDEKRFSIDGDDLLVSPAATQNLALALHELATNAAKQGALSKEGGCVRLSWHRVPIDVRGAQVPGVVLEWIEEGGPEVGEPRQSGFGRLVLSRIVPRGLSGEAELVFDPKGVRWRLVFPERNNLVVAESPSS